MTRIKPWLVPDWPAPANIHAATTLRTGGVSPAPYFSLNPATHVGDAGQVAVGVVTERGEAAGWVRHAHA